MGKTSLDWVRTIIILLILLLGFYVALSPGVVYAPTPKVVLYLLMSLLPAILFGAEAVSKFKLQLRGFIFTTTGAFAACLGLLVLLTYLSKPEEMIAVYQVLDENRQPVSLDWEGALQVSVTERGLTITKFVEGNTMVLIFPEQVGQAEVQVKRSPSGSIYSGQVSYAGSRTSKLYLGEQLKVDRR